MVRTRGGRATGSTRQTRTSTATVCSATLGISDVQPSTSQASSAGILPPSSNAQSHRKTVDTTVASRRVKRGKTCKWKEEDMISAVSLIKSVPSTSVRKAAVMFSVPRSTLRDRLSGRVEIGAKPGRKPLLDAALEEKLIDYASNRAKMGIGFGKAQFLKYAGSLAKKHKTSFKKGMPSNRWWRLVKRRHAGKVTLRQPEGTASVRHQCMDAVKVGKYFAALKDVLSSSELLDKPDRLWNMDETGLQLDVKPTKVVAKKGSKHLHSRTSGNRETITVIACVSASGKTLPPHIIVKGKTAKSLMGFNTEASPPGTNWSWSETGWTKQGLAKLWFTDTFMANIGPERPQLLVLDGHDSHNFLELIDLAVENNIHIVEMPAHTSNWLQPCDRSLFKPLKDYYRSSAQELMSQFPGVVTCRANFTGLFAAAWTKAMTPGNISSGFQSCGIYPFNPLAVPHDAYLPNYLHSIEEIMANPHIADEQHRTSVDVAGSAEDHVDDPIPQTAVDVNNAVNDVSGSSSGADGFVSVTPLTPAEALDLYEKELTSEQMTTYNYVYSNRFQLASDDTYVNWLALKVMVSASPELSERLTSETPEANCSLTVDTVTTDTVVTSPSTTLELFTSGASGISRSGSSGLEVESPVVSISLPVLESAVSAAEPATSSDLNLEASDNVVQYVPPAPDTSRELIVYASPDNEAEAQNTYVQDAGHVNCHSSHFPFKNMSYPGDGDDDVLPYPEPISHKKKVNKSRQLKYFVLTSQEAHAAKVKYHQDKLQRESKRNSREGSREN